MFVTAGTCETFRVLFDERDLADPYRFWTDDSVDHSHVEIRGVDVFRYSDGAEFAPNRQAPAA